MDSIPVDPAQIRMPSTADATTTAAAAAFTEYSQMIIYLEGEFHPSQPLREEPNGLVDVRDSALILHTGKHTGLVAVHAELHEYEPPLALDDWDEVVEVSVTSTGQGLVLRSLLGNRCEGLPDLAHAGPGSYRLRFHARGREGADETDEFVEEHAILVWPAPPEPLRAYKLTDSIGRYWRRQTSTEPPAVEPLTSDEAALVESVDLVETLVLRQAPVSGATTTVRARRTIAIERPALYRMLTLRLGFTLGIFDLPEEVLPERSFCFFLGSPRLLQVTGRYRALDPYRRIILSWAWQVRPLSTDPAAGLDLPTYPATPTVVDIRLDDADEGTAVVLTHSEVPAELNNHVQWWWDHHLSRLEVLFRADVYIEHPWERRASDVPDMPEGTSGLHTSDPILLAQAGAAERGVLWHRMSSPDAELVDLVAAASPATQRAIAVLAAHRAIEEAGMADVPWVAAALAALDAGTPLPTPWQDLDDAFRHMYADLEAGRIRATEAAGPPPEGSGSRILPQAFALPAPWDASQPDPQNAALDALHSAVITFGTGYPRLLDEVRARLRQE